MIILTHRTNLASSPGHQPFPAGRQYRLRLPRVLAFVDESIPFNCLNGKGKPGCLRLRGGLR